jgi:hypothetical protein
MLEFKNALLAEPGAKPQPMPASNVVQHYFTASTEQNINTSNTNMSQNTNEASTQQSGVPKKKSNKTVREEALNNAIGFFQRVESAYPEKSDLYGYELYVCYTNLNQPAKAKPYKQYYSK